MSVNYVILGLLQGKPMSGYDLKKEIQASPHLPWTGNNNQIYKALSQMCDQGLLASDTLHREGAPTKKLYHVTEQGRLALQDWICTTEPKAPDIHNPFLIQLSAAAGAEPALVAELLTQYRESVSNQLILQREYRRRSHEAAERDGQSLWVSDLIQDNTLRFYQSQLDWADAALRSVRAAGKE